MPKALILDLDHSEDPAHGQQPLAFFIFGLGGNSVLQKLAEPTKLRACALWVDVQNSETVPDAVRVFAEFPYAAKS